jgi:hypothetical protein
MTGEDYREVHWRSYNSLREMHMDDSWDFFPWPEYSTLQTIISSYAVFVILILILYFHIIQYNPGCGKVNV